jgi:uncharacterized protein DUF1549/uncharacterized protein DUF1553
VKGSWFLLATLPLAGAPASGADPATAPTPLAALESPAPSFRNHVLPVMTKAGCNSGSCHGAAAGKNGFKLTLRGYDPELDYLTLTRQAGARRTNAQEPARSLILLKPTMTLPHLGGKRFEVGSPEYLVLANWIAAGMPGPRDDDARIERLEVIPSEATLDVGQEMPLSVRAHFSDGHLEDVTRSVKYSSADESVARVGDDGRVAMLGHGETAINAWYLSKVASGRLRAPFPVKIEPEAYEKASRHNLIDGLVLDKLRQLHIRPAGDCTDREFIRRATLDAAGILPTPEEVEAFVADASPDKRAALVDRILARPEFVDYWAYKWSDLLLVSSRPLGPRGAGRIPRKSAESFYRWIRASVAENKPWDRFARELTVATGASLVNGAVNYFLIHKSPIDLTENYTQAFLGFTVTCARCHNHPLEKWTQKDYFGYANLFARVAYKTDGADQVVYTSPDGDLALGQGSSSPRIGPPMPPRPLDGTAIALDSPIDRRAYLADWLTSKDNRLFARTIVNRVWANFLGRGLVSPVDDLRATNPASNEDLFAAVSADFVAHGFDVQRLIRLLMASATYQRSAATDDTNVADAKYYSHYMPRRLPAEVLLDAVTQVTGVPEKFPGYAMGTRALQLPDTRPGSYFLDVFGRPPRRSTSASERQQDATLSQALHAINGDTVNRKLMAPEGTLAKLLASGRSDGEALRALYVSALGRPPTPVEEKSLLAAVAVAEGGQNGRREAYQDVAWALLTSKEFLFNH